MKPGDVVVGNDGLRYVVTGADLTKVVEGAFPAICRMTRGIGMDTLTVALAGGGDPGGWYWRRGANLHSIADSGAF